VHVSKVELTDDHDLVSNPHTYNQYRLFISENELLSHLGDGSKLECDMEFGGKVCEVEVKLKIRPKAKE
jgi:hypothetical protein